MPPPRDPSPRPASLGAADRALPGWASLLEQVLTGAETRALVDDQLGPEAAAALPRGGSHRALVEHAAGALLATVAPLALAEAVRSAAAGPPHLVDRHLATLLPTAQCLGRVAPVLPPARVLVGRGALVDGLLDALRPGLRLALTGAPGTGRRTLAAAVAREAIDRLPLVWWIDGATEIGIDLGLRALARALRAGRKDGASRSTLRDEVHQWLATVPGWMVVVADVAEPARLAARFPPGKGTVIITTEQAPRGWQPRPVPPLAPPDGERLLQRLSGSRAPGQEVHTRLCGHAGALFLMGARHPKDTQLNDILDEIGRPRTPDPDEAWATAQRHARLSLSPEASALAELLAALGPAPVPLVMLDARIDPELLPPALSMLVRSPYARRDAARELVRRGLCAWRETPAGAAVRWLGTRDRNADSLDHAAMMLQALAAARVVDGDLLDVLLPHLEEAADHGELATATRRWLSTWVGRRLDQLGEGEAAVAWFQRALAALDEESDPPGTLAGLLNDLGLAWRHAGRPLQAREVLAEALALDRARGEPLPLAATLMNLANVRMDLGEDLEASAGYSEAFRLRESMLGPRHPLTAHADLALALQLAALGELADARPRFLRVRAAYAEARGPHRADLVRALQGQARAEAQAGQPATAVDLGARAHRLLEELYGVTDARTLAARRELAAWDDVAHGHKARGSTQAPGTGPA